MRKLLITGINGFLGKHLLNELLDNIEFNNLEKIVGIDNFISSNKNKNLNSNIKYTFIEANLIKFDFNQLEKFDTVIHLASLASPVYYKKFPLETIDIGTNVTRNLLEKCNSITHLQYTRDDKDIYNEKITDDWAISDLEQW